MARGDKGKGKRKREEEEEEYHNDSESASSSGDEDIDEDEEEEEEVIEKKELPQRSTRGRRTKQLVEDEADEAFWNQDAWQEREEDDDEIKSEEFTSDDFADSSDSDMDLDEEAEQEQEAQEAAQRAKEASGGGGGGGGKRSARDIDEDDDRPAKKKSRYVDPALAHVKKKPQRQVEGDQGASTTAAPLKPIRRPALPLPPRSIQLRESTKSVTKASQHVADTEAKKAKAKSATQPVAEPVRKLTHREMLEAAVATEYENKNALAAMIALQEQKKRMREEENDQEKDAGPRIMYKSTASGDFISYSDPKMFPERKLLGDAPRPAVCQITKLSAKYRMPDTLVPFATVEAYRALKGR